MKQNLIHVEETPQQFLPQLSDEAWSCIKDKLINVLNAARYMIAVAPIEDVQVIIRDMMPELSALEQWIDKILKKELVCENSFCQTEAKEKCFAAQSRLRQKFRALADRTMETIILLQLADATKDIGEVRMYVGLFQKYILDANRAFLQFQEDAGIAKPTPLFVEHAFSGGAISLNYLTPAR